MAAIDQSTIYVHDWLMESLEKELVMLIGIGLVVRFYTFNLVISFHFLSFLCYSNIER